MFKVPADLQICQAEALRIQLFETRGELRPQEWRERRARRFARLFTFAIVFSIASMSSNVLPFA